MKEVSADTHLNCMDRALLALHSRDEPMVFHGIVSVDGAVDPARLESAVMAVLSRRPRLKSIIRGASFGPVPELEQACAGGILTVWDADGAPGAGDEDGSQAECRRDRCLREWTNQPLDPRRALPWRVLLLRETPGRSSLVFTFHHAVADGIRALRLVREIVREYNGGGDVDGPEAPERPAGTRSDDLLALARSCRRRVKHFYARVTAGLVHRFLVAPLVPRARVCRKTSKPSPEISFQQGQLHACELKGVRSAARLAGVTLNDILLAACFRTVEWWNTEHGKPSGKISIMMPVDVGGVGLLPALANMVSYISVSTTRKERSDARELARRVGLRTSQMLENGMAFTMVYAAHFCTRVPPRVSRAMAWLVMATRVCLDTVLVTNVGRVWPHDGAATGGVMIGSARIASVAVIPPVASPMGLSLATAICDGRLHITLAYKTAHLSPAQARGFLGSYLEELRGYQVVPAVVPASGPAGDETRTAAPA